MLLDNNIMDICIEKHITIAQLAKMSGLGRSHLYGIINNEKRPRLDTAMLIAKALQVDLKDLFSKMEF